MVTALKETVARLDERVKSMPDAKVLPGPSRVTISPRMEQKLLDGSVQEKMERERCAPNVIVFKLPEPNTIYKEDMMKMDKAAFGRMCDVMELKGIKDKVKECKRLGMKRDDGRPRVMLVVLDDYDTIKGLIFKNMKKIKNTDYDSININNELTKMQRDTLQKMWDEAKRKTEEDSAGNWVYRVVGPPWGWNIKPFERRDMMEVQPELVQPKTQPGRAANDRP